MQVSARLMAHVPAAHSPERERLRPHDQVPHDRLDAIRADHQIEPTRLAARELRHATPHLPVRPILNATVHVVQRGAP